MKFIGGVTGLRIMSVARIDSIDTGDELRVTASLFNARSVSDSLI